MGSLDETHSTGLPEALLIRECVWPNAYFSCEVQEALQSVYKMIRYLHVIHVSLQGCLPRSREGRANLRIQH